MEYYGEVLYCIVLYFSIVIPSKSSYLEIDDGLFVPSLLYVTLTNKQVILGSCKVQSKEFYFLFMDITFSSIFIKKHFFSLFITS